MFDYIVCFRLPFSLAVLKYCLRSKISRFHLNCYAPGTEIKQKNRQIICKSAQVVNTSCAPFPFICLKPDNKVFLIILSVFGGFSHSPRRHKLHIFLARASKQACACSQSVLCSSSPQKVYRTFRGPRDVLSSLKNPPFSS